jgi:hypothetical protein
MERSVFAGNGQNRALNGCFVTISGAAGFGSDWVEGDWEISGEFLDKY